MYPKIRIGKFNTKLIMPVFTGVTIPKIIAIRQFHYLKFCGDKEKIKGNRNNNRTDNNTKESDHFFPSFTEKFILFQDYI